MEKTTTTSNWQRGLQEIAEELHRLGLDHGENLESVEITVQGLTVSVSMVGREGQSCTGTAEFREQKEVEEYVNQIERCKEDGLVLDKTVRRWRRPAQ